MWLQPSSWKFKTRNSRKSVEPVFFFIFVWGCFVTCVVHWGGADVDRILKLPVSCLGLIFCLSLIGLCCPNLCLSLSSSIIIDIIHSIAFSPLSHPTRSHTHTVRDTACILPAFVSLAISLHLKTWSLMDWKSWGRSNSHLKINVKPDILKGSQPSLCVCLCMCVSSGGHAHIIPVKMPSSLSPIRQRLRERNQKKVSWLPHTRTYHGLSLCSQYPLLDSH